MNSSIQGGKRHLARCTVIARQHQLDEHAASFFVSGIRPLGYINPWKTRGCHGARSPLPNDVTGLTI
ncbi:hypothetical protein GDO81_001053 [Engystomops pustulosus]|uniref:Uncharacterized protein n=1 Tax=Engystomops pustulosus TaxID=76066 RepID=A0AAV7DCY0_ENGPU|nr:hypothetical protein GDO81_001053 [Engystomops pustulosus]